MVFFRIKQCSIYIKAVIIRTTFYHHPSQFEKKWKSLSSQFFWSFPSVSAPQISDSQNVSPAYLNDTWYSTQYQTQYTLLFHIWTKRKLDLSIKFVLCFKYFRASSKCIQRMLKKAYYFIEGNSNGTISNLIELLSIGELLEHLTQFIAKLKI